MGRFSLVSCFTMCLVATATLFGNLYYSFGRCLLEKRFEARFLLSKKVAKQICYCSVIWRWFFFLKKKLRSLALIMIKIMETVPIIQNSSFVVYGLVVALGFHCLTRVKWYDLSDGHMVFTCQLKTTNDSNNKRKKNEQTFQSVSTLMICSRSF